MILNHNEIITRSLLDSSLIFTNKNKNYTHKIVQCGKYIQVYNYQDIKIKKEKEVYKIEKYDKIIHYSNITVKKENKKKEKLKKVELKNIQRSKLQMQRIVKSNEEVFKTFWTLTFKDEVGDVSVANQIFKNFRDTLTTTLKRQKKEFKYVCVPEFQKKREKKYGSPVIHYHLLTNIDLNSDIIIPQKDRKNCYDVKFWNYGFSSVYSMDNINVVGYLTKYMTKDIDNRLFGKRRFFYSRNLIKPSIIYLNENDERDNSHLLIIKLLENKIYENYYSDLTGLCVKFEEYRVGEGI